MDAEIEVPPVPLMVTMHSAGINISSVIEHEPASRTMSDVPLPQSELTVLLIDEQGIASKRLAAFVAFLSYTFVAFLVRKACTCRDTASRVEENVPSDALEPAIGWKAALSS